MRRLQDRLADILDACDRIAEAERKGRTVFLHDPYVQVWVIHHIQLIGEAVRAAADELQELRPDGPWREIIAMRHFLVHQYFGVELETVWAVVEHDLPPLRRIIQDLLSEIDAAKPNASGDGP